MQNIYRQKVRLQIRVSARLYKNDLQKYLCTNMFWCKIKVTQDIYEKVKSCFKEDGLESEDDWVRLYSNFVAVVDSLTSHKMSVARLKKDSFEYVAISYDIKDRMQGFKNYFSQDVDSVINSIDVSLDEV